MKLGGRRVGVTNYLPSGLVFYTNDAAAVSFDIDGTCGRAGVSSNTFELLIYERDRPGTALESRLTLHRVTGHVRIED